MNSSISGVCIATHISAVPIRKEIVLVGSRFLGYQPHRVLYFWHYLGNKFLTLLSNCSKVTQTMAHVRPKIQCWWPITRHFTVALIGVFFLTTIRSGQSWGDDWAQYLLQAENVIHFIPYAETGYVYNSQNAIVGPKAYPSVYPAALAPVIALCGANLNAYKALDVLFFLVGLLIATKLFSNDLSARNTWICLTIVGFSPVFWNSKDYIVSELLFLPLWYAALLVADDWYRRQKVYRNQMLHGLILGLLIFLTCATRTVGIVLLPAVCVCEALLARRPTRVGICALATAIGLLFAERFIQPASGAGYLSQLSGITMHTLLENVYSDTTSFSLIWENRHWNEVRKVAGAGFAVLALIGFLRANCTRPTPLGVAMAAYFVVIVAWPSADGLRMTLPLLPGFVFYVLLGMNPLRSIPHPQSTASGSTVARGPAGVLATGSMATTCKWRVGMACIGRWTTHAGSLALLAFSLLSFGAAYSAADLRPFQTGVETRDAVELFDFVRNHTRPDEVCLFFKPRALVLYTGRRSSAYPIGTDEQQFWQYAESIGARVVIVREGAADLYREDQTSEMRAPYGAANLEEVFHNSMFRVYRMIPSPTAS